LVEEEGGEEKKVDVKVKLGSCKSRRQTHLRQ
jgi:hypothetical protein